MHDEYWTFGQHSHLKQKSFIFQSKTLTFAWLKRVNKILDVINVIKYIMLDVIKITFELMPDCVLMF